jgi:nitrite reductase/ring-hydroxylating ferredoxin subunit
MAYQVLEKLINLHDGYRRVVQVSGQQLLLLQENGTPRLVGRYCPHAGQALDNAGIEGDAIVCPYHQIKFSLISGDPSVKTCRALPIYELVYEGNSVGVDPGLSSA